MAIRLQKVHSSNSSHGKAKAVRDFGRFQTSNSKLIQCIDIAITTATLPGVLTICGKPGSGRRLLAEIIIDRVGSDRLKRWSSNEFPLAAGDVILIENVDHLSVDLQQKISKQMEETRSVVKWIVTVEQKNISELQTSLTQMISGFQLCIPGLKERKEDFKFLVNQFLSIFAMISNKPTPKISDMAMEMLSRNEWPGNVAELERVLEKAVHICGSEIMPHHLSFESKHVMMTSQQKDSLAEMEKKLILQTLEVTRYNKTKAAEMLGISIRTLRNKLHIYREEGIQL
jgi:DNA-binding NtrC family response regulator